MLTTYQTRTQQLLQSPGAPTSLYDVTTVVTPAINQARGQLAGEAECVRYLGTISTTINQRNYSFSSISTGTASVTGVQGAFNARSIRYAVGDGYQWVTPRAWEWFEFFSLNTPVPASGPPVDWSQHKQGSAGSGSITGIGAGSMISGTFFLDPIPDLAYSLVLDCNCYPQLLAADTDVEAIPYPFTDAVAYLAACIVLWSSQTNARMADAERYFGYYQTFMNRARTFSNPSVLRGLYEQAVDQTQINKLGLTKSDGARQ